MIHPLAGVLSAYGMGLADMVELRQRTLAGGDLEAVLGRARSGGGGGARRRRAWRRRKSVRRAALRYEGSDSSLEVPVSDRMRADFEAAHKARFGFTAPETEVVVETAIVEAVGKSESVLLRKQEPRSERLALGSCFRRSTSMIETTSPPATSSPAPP